MLVDSHCHLDFDDFDVDRAGILARAHAAGVQEMLIAAVVEAHWPRVQALTAEYPGVWAAAGVHPNEPAAETPEWEHLLAALAVDKVVAVGETGLDYFRSEGDLSWQRERFARHIAASKATGKPLIVHTRAAAADTIAMLRSEEAAAVGGVIHCFTENWEFCEGCHGYGLLYILFRHCDFQEVR
jgi:Mg-dependent DNase